MLLEVRRLAHKELIDVELINCDIDGFGIGLKLAKECDLINRENATVNEKRMIKETKNKESM